MSPLEIIAAGVVGIFFVVGIVREVFPQIPSRAVPLINLVLGVGLTVWVALTNDLNILELIISALLPALGASGVHSTANTYKQ